MRKLQAVLLLIYNFNSSHINLTSKTLCIVFCSKKNKYWEEHKPLSSVQLLISETKWVNQITKFDQNIKEVVFILEVRNSLHSGLLEELIDQIVRNFFWLLLRPL